MMRQMPSTEALLTTQTERRAIPWEANCNLPDNELYCLALIPSTRWGAGKISLDQPPTYRMSHGQSRARPHPWQGWGNSPGSSGRAAANDRGAQETKGKCQQKPARSNREQANCEFQEIPRSKLRTTCLVFSINLETLKKVRHLPSYLPVVFLSRSTSVMK